MILLGTTAALFLRLFDVRRGSVTFDGHDVRTLDVDWMRKHIGFVGQEPILFDMTIKLV